MSLNDSKRKKASSSSSSKSSPLPSSPSHKSSSKRYKPSSLQTIALNAALVTCEDRLYAILDDLSEEELETLKEKTDGITSSLNERLQVFEKERVKKKKEKDAKYGKGYNYKGPGALLCQFCKKSTFDPGHGDISAAAGIQGSGNYSSCIRKVTDAEKKEAAAKALAAGITEKDQAPITDEMYYWGDKEVGHTVPGTDESCMKTTFVSACNNNCCSKCRSNVCEYCELRWCPDCAEKQSGYDYDYNMNKRFKYCDNCEDSYREHRVDEEFDWGY